MSKRLHEYQLEAVEHLWANPHAGLFMEMGLGKTASVLCALLPEHLPALVTAPKRVAETVWPAEGRRWRDDLGVALAAGRPAARKAALESGADLVVIGRDNLADAVRYADRFRTFVVDELSGFKTRKTNRWKSARKIAQRVDNVWGLTGTPTPNGLMDLWAQMYLLDGGKRLGTRITDYRDRFFVPGQRLPSGVVTEWIPRRESLEAILGLIEDVCLSMKSLGRLDLPPVTYNVVEVPLEARTRALYKEYKRDLMTSSELLALPHTAANAAVMTNRLSQVSAGFLYDQDELGNSLDSYTVLHREKLNAAQEVIDGTGSPVLVFYQYRAERDLLLKHLTPTPRTIDEPDVIEDWEAGRVPVLLAHPQSAGHGLNLQHGGHTVLWVSLTWSLEEWDQGNARINRQGQQHPVVIHMLVSPRTVDEAKRMRVQDKASVQDAVMRHLEAP